MANYQVKSGDDLVIVHSFGSQGSPFDLSGSSIYWRLFEDPDDADADAVLTYTWIAGAESGLSLTDPESLTALVPSDGVLFNHLTNTVTAAFTQGRTYFYEIKIVDTNGFVRTLEQGTLSVDASPSLSPPRGTPRYLLRRTISKKLGNGFVVTATANSGNATDFIDNLHLRNPDDAFRGRQIYFFSGANGGYGQTRYISSSTQSTTKVTFPAASANILAGDIAEIHNVRGSGWTVEDIHDEIDTCLRFASSSLPNYDRDNIATAFDLDSPTLSIPDSFRAVYRIDWLDDDGFYHEIDAAGGANDIGWWLNTGQREIVINGDYRTWADTHTVRVYGVKDYGPMTSDSATTTCNEEWLVLQVCANLMSSGAERVSDGTRSQWALQYQKQADQRRDLLVGPPPSNLVLV